LRLALNRGDDVLGIWKNWEINSNLFFKMSKKYYLYP